MSTTMKTTKPMIVRDLLLKLADFDLDMPVYIGKNKDTVVDLSIESEVQVEEIEVGDDVVNAVVIEP